jgi:beta-glucosidase/6-phospho-beta-glucosidase/beta-galactosidase
MIPTNGSFINNPKDVEFYEKMIEEYKKVGVQINFSLSDDGLYLDELNRPYTNSNRSDIENFYNKIFEFCKKYEYAFHPMIAANGIEH